ncbi:glycine betaine ABC transporter substrate-binding protein [Haladaptatus pallidirubidus]|uniref:ABC-type glycine betaine transport system substrate-binding domain-containing protein n=1 Tax=Haladaptatus pallidirubidus TaxID=1008152 RepID=A0AAV3URY2_9EURY|nr:glycine betaine ABC transporter substrate-binding protein [Haladaptatus pallidirubidus]
MTTHITRRTTLKAGGATLVGASTGGCLGLINGGSGKSIVVSSKNFTEQFLLSQLSIKLLENEGHSVEDKTGLGGSPANFKALKNSESDTYWEYTGTAWSNVLDKETQVSDPKKLYNKVDQAYNERWQIDWLQRAPFNNTYVIMANPKWAQKTGVKSLSELAEYVKKTDTSIKIAMNPEMEQREDSWGGLPKAYGFAEAAKQKMNPVTMKIGLAYKAVANNQAQLGFGFATDPKIQKYNLPIVEDNNNFFIVYNPAPNARDQKFDESVKSTVNKIAPKLDTKTMRSLNAKVDIDGKDPAAVAEKFLTQKGLI